jgi:hypothetical protein
MGGSAPGTENADHRDERHEHRANGAEPSAAEKNGEHRMICPAGFLPGSVPCGLE